MRESFNVNWKRWANSFTLLIPFYFIVYFAEKFISPASGIGTEFGNLASVKTVLVGLVNVPNILWTWVKYILFPSMYNLIPQENLRSYSSIIVEATSSLILWNAGAILGIFGVTALSLGRKQKYQFTSLIVYLLLVFVAVISVFRTNTHGALYVLRNGYNSYMFGAWFILLIYLLISRAKAQWVLTVLLLVPTCLSGMMVFNMNQSIKEGEQPLRAYFAYIDDFVQEHKGENDFTFRATIDSPLEKGLAFPLVRVVNKAQIHENHSIPEALYEEYWDSGTPKYILEYSPSTNRVEVK